MSASRKSYDAEFKLIVHSDSGVQYACGGFRQMLTQHGFVKSMSRKGDCWDNAVAESFFKAIKTGLIYQYTFSPEFRPGSKSLNISSPAKTASGDIRLWATKLPANMNG